VVSAWSIEAEDPDCKGPSFVYGAREPVDGSFSPGDDISVVSFAWTISGNGTISGPNDGPLVVVTSDGAGSFTLSLDVNNPEYRDPATDVICTSGASSLTVIRESTQPSIDVPQTSFDLGNILVGEAVTVPVTVENTGTGTLTISAIEVVGSLPAVVVDALPIEIPQGTTIELLFSATPGAEGSLLSEALIFSNCIHSAAATVELAANAAFREQPEVDPVFDFGEVPVDDTAVTIPITNPGLFPLTITRVLVGGKGITLTTPVPFVIPPGGVVDLAFEVTPGTPVNEDILITTNAGGPGVIVAVRVVVASVQQLQGGGGCQAGAPEGARGLVLLLLLGLSVVALGRRRGRWLAESAVR
jgi:hypothetical protein